MAATSSLTLFHSAFTSSQQLSQPEFTSVHLQPFASSKLWRHQLANKIKVPAIFTNRNARVRVSAGYTKRPMEAPGAYEVVDEESGERVIVWGGVDDDGGGGGGDINSEQFISRNRNNHDKKAPRTGEKNGGYENTISAATTQRSTRGFGRLKAQKVRNLISKASREKQGTNDRYEEVDIDETDDDDDQTVLSDSKDVYIKGMRNTNVKSGIEQLLDDQLGMRSGDSSQNLRKAASSASATRPKGWNNGEPRQSTRLEPRDLKNNINYSRDIYIKGMRNTNVNSGEQLVDDHLGMSSVDSNQKVRKTVPSGSATRSKGWSNGEASYSSRGEPRDLKYDLKYSARTDFFSRKSFKDLPCSDDMIDSLRAQGFVRPSHIQAMAYAPATEGKSCIIADQSGSGKTLAYLAPLIQRLRQEEIKEISKSASKSPRAVVLVPTAELASQVLRNCRSISRYGVPFRSMVATGGFRQRTQLESLEQDLDVLIATPGRFMYLIKEGFLQLTNLRCAVLDEIDVLFRDEDFEQALQRLITSSPVTTQYLFVTATLPVDIYNKLVEVFPDCKVIMGPGMHRTSSGLEEVLVDCSGDEGSEKTPETAFSNKKAALLKLAEENPVSKTIVFCNKIETCRKVENALKRTDRKQNQIRVLPFHSAMEQETRLANMKDFISSDTENRSRSLFLICTDRASRGIDFPSVDHVVLFDFPRDPSEYVRRVGRTARGAAGKGSAFIFVVGKQVSLARRIIDRNQKGHPLHDVPSAYELER